MSYTLNVISDFFRKPENIEAIIQGVTIAVTVGILFTLARGVRSLFAAWGKYVASRKLFCPSCGRWVPFWFGRIIMHESTSTSANPDMEIECFHCQDISRYPSWWNFPIIRIKVKNKGHKKPITISKKEFRNRMKEMHRRNKMIQAMKDNKI